MATVPAVVRSGQGRLRARAGAPRFAVSSDRFALIAFVTLELASLPLLLRWGRGGWFTFDDWDLLARRTGGSVRDLFTPHYLHWSTLPILAYRLLWWMFGIRTYVPYQLLAIVSHLVVAALLRAVMRRAGVSAWTATAAAALFVLFGAVADTIVSGFFVTFIAAVAFGLTHLLLADHEGAIDHRDFLGVLAGFLGLMCSGVAVAMVGVVGVSALLRRRWIAALFHTVPLGIAYATWFVTIGHDEPRHLPVGSPTFGEMLRFVAVGVRASFRELGALPGLGIVFAVALFVGMAFALRTAHRAGSPLWRTQEPLALFAGALAFLLITGSGRAGRNPVVPGSGPEYARQGRYVYVVVAMLLPTLALAADALARRWRVMAGVLAAVALVALVGNTQKFDDLTRAHRFATAYKQTVLIAPRVPLATRLPRSVEPRSLEAPELTLGWLISGVQSGRVPPPHARAPVDVSTVTLVMAVVRSRALQTDHCVATHGPIERVLHARQAITIVAGSADVVYLPASGAPSRPVHFNPYVDAPLTLMPRTGPLRLRVSPAPADNVVCG
jgi:hypothetical protein